MLDSTRLDLSMKFLNKSEIRILFILENYHGSKDKLNISEIARRSGLARSTVHANIFKLLKRHLVVQLYFGRRKYYRLNSSGQGQGYLREAADYLRAASKVSKIFYRFITPTIVILEKPKHIGSYLFDICAEAIKQNRPIIQILCGYQCLFINTETSNFLSITEPKLIDHFRAQAKTFLNVQSGVLKNQTDDYEYPEPPTLEESITYRATHQDSFGVERFLS